MKRAAAIVTDRGGRTCHAAIVSRELGVPCVVGTGNGTEVLPDGQVVTVSCAEGESGSVYRGALPFERRQVDLAALPTCRTKVMLNVGNPGEAFRLAALPNDGVGLARIEFIIGSFVRVHPMALLHPERVRRPGRARGDRGADARVRRARGLLRRPPRRGDGDHRRRLLPEGRHRPPLGLQDQRVRGTGRWARLRAGRGQSHARLSRGVPLRAPAIPRGLRARVPRRAPGARGHGARERQADDPVLPDAPGGPARPRAARAPTGSPAATTASRCT